MLAGANLSSLSGYCFSRTLSSNLLRRCYLSGISSFEKKKISLISEQVEKNFHRYETFLTFDDATRIALMIESLVDRALEGLNVTYLSQESFPNKWSFLQKCTEYQTKITPGFRPLREFDLKNIINCIDTVSLSTLLNLQPETLKLQQNTILRNKTEKNWASHSPTFPLTGLEYENHTALKCLVLPNLKSNYIVKELGCWNGDILIRLAFEAFKNNIILKELSGIDLNDMALQCGNSLLHYLKTESISLYNGHATDDLFLRRSSDDPQMILAFRLISVFDEKSIDFLFSKLQKIAKYKDLFCFSYSLPYGDRYQQVMANQRTRKVKHEETGGVTIYSGDSVFQTYLHPEGFTHFLRKYQFKEIDFKEEHNRMISLFERIT